MSIAPLTRFPNGPVCSVFTSKTLVDDISRYENKNCLNVRLERGLNAWTELQMSCDDQGIPKAFTELELNILRVDSSHRNFGIENKIMSVRLEIRGYETVVDADWITKSTGFSARWQRPRWITDSTVERHESWIAFSVDSQLVGTDSFDVFDDYFELICIFVWSPRKFMARFGDSSKNRISVEPHLDQ